MNQRVNTLGTAPPDAAPSPEHPVVQSFNMKPEIFTMSESLEQAVRDWTDPEIRRYLAPLPPEQQDVARRRAIIWGRYLTVVITREALVTWMTPLITAVENTPSKELFRGRAAAVYAAIPDMPAVVLNDIALRAALRECGYHLPAVNKIVRVLEAERSRLFVLRRALAGLGDPSQGAPQTPRKAPTAEEVAAVDRMLRDWEGKRPDEAPPVPPRPAYAEGDVLRDLRSGADRRPGGMRPIGAVMPTILAMRPAAPTIDAETAAAPGEGTPTPPEGDPSRAHSDHEGQPDRGC